MPTTRMPGDDHLAQRRRGADVHAGSVVRRLGPLHDLRVRLELAAHFRDHLLGGGADSADRQRAEEEDQHRADKGGDEDERVRHVDRLAWIDWLDDI